MKSKFELKDGEGSIFKNDKKAKESDGDYTGSLRISGTDYSIVAYKKQAKSGVNYLRMLVRPKGATTGKRAADFDDDLGI